MNPAFIVLCACLQVAILYVSAPSASGVVMAIPAVVIVAMLAYSRIHWDSHLDMLLLMTAPGGLGMMLPLAWPTAGLGPLCHTAPTWNSYLVMSLGMWLVAGPLSWQYARCIRQARQAGLGATVLLADLFGMQLGMALAYLPMSLLPLANPRGAWLHHAFMLSGMLLGMMAGMLSLRRWLPWIRSPAPAHSMKAGGTFRGMAYAVRLRAKGAGPA